jgi:hypothetical protein
VIVKFLLWLTLPLNDFLERFISCPTRYEFYKPDKKLDALLGVVEVSF